jgi:hypothetical protein
LGRPMTLDRFLTSPLKMQICNLRVRVASQQLNIDHVSIGVPPIKWSKSIAIRVYSKSMTGGHL